MSASRSTCGTRQITPNEIATVALIVITGAILGAQSLVYPTTSTNGSRSSNSLGFERLCYEEFPARPSIHHDIHGSAAAYSRPTDETEESYKKRVRKSVLSLIVDWSMALASNDPEAASKWEKIAEEIANVVFGAAAPAIAETMKSDDVLSLSIQSNDKPSNTNPRALLAVFLAFVSDTQKRLPSPDGGAAYTPASPGVAATISISGSSLITFTKLMALLEEEEVSKLRETLLEIFKGITINSSPEAPTVTRKSSAPTNGVMRFLRYTVDATQPTVSICTLPAPRSGTSAPRREPVCQAVHSLVMDTSSPAHPVESRPQAASPPPLSTFASQVVHPFATATGAVGSDQSSGTQFTPSVSSAFTRNIVPIGTKLPSSCVRLFMGQLRKDNTEEAVLFMLEQTVPHITLLRVQPHTNPQTGRGKGCAWVYVASEADAHDVLKLHKRAFFDCASPVDEHKGCSASDLATAKRLLSTSSPNNKGMRNASEGIWISSSVFTDSPLTLEEETFFNDLANSRAFVARRPGALPRRSVVVEIPQTAEKSLTGIVSREGHHPCAAKPFIPRYSHVPSANFYTAARSEESLTTVPVNISFSASSSVTASNDSNELTKLYSTDRSRFCFNPYGSAVRNQLDKKRVDIVGASSLESASSAANGASEDHTESESVQDDDVASLCAEAATSRQVSSFDWLLHEGSTWVAE